MNKSKLITFLIVVSASYAIFIRSSFRMHLKASELDIKGRKNSQIKNLTYPLPIKNFLQKITKVSDFKNTYLEQSGKMRPEYGTEFLNFNAIEVFSVSTPEYTWQVEFETNPFFTIKSIDQLQNNIGEVTIKLSDFFNLYTQYGLPIQKSQLIRYMAELVWNPQMLLKNENIEYREINKTEVEIIMRIETTIAKVRVHFGPDGLIESIRALDRSMYLDGKLTPTEWLVEFKNYTWYDGLNVPTLAEYFWISNDKKNKYQETTVTSFTRI